ncbi:MAG: ABC transporter ATP-binding protein/permease [Exilispira sp.]|jgi:ABC-type multidrug transport system fused ATPase/permease subunit|nr:ABC transporter ATP-binding protein/permease [Exilispira sp.]
MEYFENEQIEEKLYDKRVSSFLLKYIMKYKKYVFISLFLIVIITGVSLIVPYISKVFLDRYVIKNGFIAYPNKLVEEKIFNLEKSAFIFQKISKSIKLENNTYFFLQSDLRFFSKKEIEILKANSILSTDSFVLIESRKNPNNQFYQLISKLIEENKALGYNDKYLVYENYYKKLNLNQMLILREYDIFLIFEIVIFIIIAFTIQFVVTYYQTIILQKLSQFSMRDLRSDLFSKMLTYEVSYFDKNPIGKLVNRVSNDIEVLNELFSEVLVSLFRDIILIIGILIFMFWQNIYLALAVSVVFPFIVVITILFRVKSADAYRKVRTVIAQINGFFSETISGIRIIQLFSAEKKNYKKFDSINRSLYKANIEQMYVYATFRPLIDFLRWFSVASVIYFGARGILNNTISYGLIFLFTQYIANLFEPIGDLSEKFDIMISANAAGEKILSVFEADVRTEKDSDKQILAFENQMLKKSRYESYEKAIRFKGNVEFNHVWFSYKPDEWILKDVSFKIEPQKTVAIVGETGAGKSTIISLLTHFFEIQKGTILIDDIPLYLIPYNILRKNLAVVMQDVFLFAKSVKDNIILNSDYDEEKFINVCKMTHIDKFISNLPNRENEMVMERGVTFSAGERQLLSFARALYYDPSILILDEATSNIDSETEKLIQDAISNLIKNRTSIIIAHRLSTIKSADLILVIDNGKIVESGTHFELISKKGIYYTLYKLQFEPI